MKKLLIAGLLLSGSAMACLSGVVEKVKVNRLSLQLYETEKYYLDTVCEIPAIDAEAKIVNKEHLVIGRSSCKIYNIIKK